MADKAAHAPQSLARLIRDYLQKSNNQADTPPDGGVVAWLQVVGCFFMILTSYGITFAFGVYQAYYELVMLPHHSASAISWIGTTQASFTFFVGLFSGPLFDKGFFLPTVVVASIGLVFSYMMLSISKEYWQILLCQGFLAGICSGMLYIPSVSQISRYFSTKRGLAIGIVFSGAGIGGIVYPFIFRNLLDSLGFAWATRVIGFISLGFLIVAIVLIRPLKISSSPKTLRDPTMYKDPYYVTFLLTGFLLAGGMMVPYFDCGTFWVAKFNHNMTSAFHTLIIMNAGSVVGRIFFPTLTDYGVPPEYMLSTCILAAAALGFGWIGLETKPAYYSFLVLWGFFSAGLVTLPACIMPYVCPRPEVFGTRMGVLFGLSGFATLIGVPIANAIDASPVNFLGAQLWTGISCALAVLTFAHTGFGARRRRVQIQHAQRAKNEQDNTSAESSEA